MSASEVIPKLGVSSEYHADMYLMLLVRLEVVDMPIWADIVPIAKWLHRIPRLG